MSKLVSFLFIINFGVVFFNFHSIYRNERRLFSSFIRFSNTKMGTTMLNSLILLFLYSMCDFGILLFFGGLRPFETDRIKERIWFAVTDTFLAFAVFSSDISSNLLLSLALLLFIKYFHFAFEVRIGSIERDVVIPKSTILKSSVFFIFFLFMDLFFVHYLYVYSDNSDNIQHLMINEYAILCINLVYNMVKLIIHYIDYIKDYAFHAKITLFSYLFIFKCMLETLTHLFFLMLTIFRHGVLPILFIRPLMSSLSGFIQSLKTQINCNKVVSYINKICPDATDEEITNAHDTTCVVCREEMTECKKLPCGHMFHLQCLKSWFQRQQTCPTCRLDMLSLISTTRNNQRNNTTPPNPAEIEQLPQNSAQSQPSNENIYEEKYINCNCVVCKFSNNQDFTGLPPDPVNFIGHPNEQLLGDLDDKTINAKLIQNIRLNLEAVFAQINYLEARLNYPNQDQPST